MLVACCCCWAACKQSIITQVFSISVIILKIMKIPKIINLIIFKKDQIYGKLFTCSGLAISPVSVSDRLLTPLRGAALASSSSPPFSSPPTAFRSTMRFGFRFSLFNESTQLSTFSVSRISWESAVRVVVEPQLLPDKLGKEIVEVKAESGDPPSNIA